MAKAVTVHLTYGMPRDFDLATVDAAAWMYFIALGSEPALSTQRVQHATGMIAYEFSTPDYPNLAIFFLRAFQHQTQILIGQDTAHPALSEEQEQIRVSTFFGVLGRFVSWFDADVKKFKAAADDYKNQLELNLTGPTTSEMLNQLPKAPRGRPTSQHNNYVRSQLQDGQPPEEVFRNYLVLEAIDPEDQDKVKLARERFRKAANTSPRKQPRKQIRKK